MVALPTPVPCGITLRVHGDGHAQTALQAENELREISALQTFHVEVATEVKVSASV